MSFASYLDSLGAKPQRVYGSATRQLNQDHGNYYYTDYGRDTYKVGDKPKIVKPIRYAHMATPYNAYVDRSGGFLGYGSSYEDLKSTPALGVNYNEYIINDQDRIAQQKRDSLANQQAQLSIAQQRAAMRGAAVNSPQFTGSGLVGMGQQGMAPQQMAPQQQFSMGRAAVPGMGRSAVPGQGLLGGMHRGGNL
tara:strand:+ start:38 stop:616 length:579 start_codon:yes stop_codon:yes gene_type:complete